MKQLGYYPYDFVDRQQLGHIPAWIEAMRAKWYDDGPEWGREQFDKLTGDFDVCVTLSVRCARPKLLSEPLFRYV